MVCCFFGHKDAPPEIRPKLYSVVEALIEEGTDDFLVGHQGEFDRIVLHTIRELKQKYPHITYHVVLAYMPGQKTDHELYDPAETLYPEGMEKVHPRYAISKRNEYMIRESDVVVTYITHSWGGTAKFAGTASRKGKRVINIAESI